jgi:hypothetical protein
VREDENFEVEVVDRGSRVTDDSQHLRQTRRDDLGRRHVLSRSRQTGQHFV